MNTVIKGLELIGGFPHREGHYLYSSKYSDYEFINGYIFLDRERLSEIEKNFDKDTLWCQIVPMNGQLEFLSHTPQVPGHYLWTWDGCPQGIIYSYFDSSNLVNLNRPGNTLPGLPTPVYCRIEPIK
jgi:hypothetical protein